MNQQNDTAQVAVMAEPCPKFAPLVTTPIGKSWEGDPLTNREARRLVNEVRTWARQFNAPDALALVDAMDGMERLLLRAWTEIDESLLCLSLVKTATTQQRSDQLRTDAMNHLSRWNNGGGVAP